MGTFQGLDGRFLVDTEHNRVVRRVEVQPDDVRNLGRKGRIPAHLIRAGKMRLDAVGAQDVGHAAAGASDRVPQETSRPPASPGRRGRQRELHDLLDRLHGDGVVSAARLRTVTQPVHALLHEASPDPRHRFRRQVEPSGDLHAADAGRTQENDPGAADQSRGFRRAGDEGFQHLLLLTSRSQLVRMCHARIRSHT